MTHTISKKNNGMSTTKANRLFWMGRYAERVYLTFHILRKHVDVMIDENSNAYKDFCKEMGIMDSYTSSKDFLDSFMYSYDNNDSIIKMLEHVNDNAILLREEITSETLSYIHLAIDYMKESKEKGKTLGSLQYVTDCILAFWGSIDERITTANVRRIIKFGKFVESSDILIRFNYPLDRINNLYQRMKECVNSDPEMYNKDNFSAFEGQLTPEDYKDSKTLSYVNTIFTA